KSAKRHMTRKKKKKLYQAQLYWNMMPFELVLKIMNEVKTHVHFVDAYTYENFSDSVSSMYDVCTPLSNVSITWDSYTYDTIHIEKKKQQSTSWYPTHVLDHSFIRGRKEAQTVRERHIKYKTRKKFCSKNPRVQNKHTHRM